VSESSDKGVWLEDYIVTVLKQKLGARVQRDGKSGAGSHQKMDINDYFRDTPLDIEAKNQAVIAIKKWFSQARAGASMGRMPTIVFKADEEVLACLRFTDLADLLATSQQNAAEVKRLREPVPVLPGVVTLSGKPLTVKSSGITVCRGGFIVSPGSNKCLQKGCPFCSNKKVKAKK
jgi:hypothetical protein